MTDATADNDEAGREKQGGMRIAQGLQHAAVRIGLARGEAEPEAAAAAAAAAAAPVVAAVPHAAAAAPLHPCVADPAAVAAAVLSPVAAVSAARRPPGWSLTPHSLQTERDAMGTEVVLGQGGFAQVVRGRYNGQIVAVKKMLPPPKPLKLTAAEAAVAAARHRAALKDLITEMNLLWDLSSPYIVQVLGGVLWPDESGASVVMEYSNRGSLWHMLRMHPLQAPAGQRAAGYQPLAQYSAASHHLPSSLPSSPLLSWEQKSVWMWELARGLAYLHNKNVAHRDLKSANLLLFESSTAEKRLHIKLADFGLSLQHRDSPHVMAVQGNTIHGTARWLAPECFQRATVIDLRPADVWSFGAVLLELSSHDIPFPALPTKQIEQVMLESPQLLFQKYLNKLPSDTPESYLMLMRDCMQIDPAQRPTAHELVERTLDACRSIAWQEAMRTMPQQPQQQQQQQQPRPQHPSAHKASAASDLAQVTYPAAVAAVVNPPLSDTAAAAAAAAASPRLAFLLEQFKKGVDPFLYRPKQVYADETDASQDAWQLAGSRLLPSRVHLALHDAEQQRSLDAERQRREYRARQIAEAARAAAEFEAAAAQAQQRIQVAKESLKRAEREEVAVARATSRYVDERGAGWNAHAAAAASAAVGSAAAAAAAHGAAAAAQPIASEAAAAIPPSPSSATALPLLPPPSTSDASLSCHSVTSLSARSRKYWPPPSSRTRNLEASLRQEHFLSCRSLNAPEESGGGL
jgi:serine/threonine protein kinase